MKNVIERNGRHYFRRKRRGVDTYIRLPSPSDVSFADAVALADAVTRKRESDSPLAAKALKVWHRRRYGYAAGDCLPRELVYAAREARKRAQRRGLEFDLNPERLMVLWRRSEGACELTGIPFDSERGEHRWPPFAVSLDRRDNSKGYVYSNVRLVCVCVNAALNQWGDDVFWRMVFSASERLRGDTEIVCPPFIESAAKSA